MRTFLFIAFYLVAGCASNEAEQGLSENTMFCTEEKELGSHITQTRCRTVRQMEAEQHSRRETLRRSAVNIPDSSMQQFAQ